MKPFFVFVLLTATLAAHAQFIGISQQPTNQVLPLGGIAGSGTYAFSVVAYGTAPISYRWYFTNSMGITAGAYAQTLSGFVYGVVVTNGGQGYTFVPQVQFIGGGGSGAVAYASISNGLVSSINVSNAGSGYTSVPMVQIDSPNGRLPGQTNANLFIFNGVTTNNVGNYWCVVSNASGSVTSSVASLNLAATILTPPQSQFVWTGQTTTFSVFVDAAGPYTYQWKFNGANITGATNGSFTIPITSTNDAGNYTVQVANQNSSVLSPPAALTVDWISQQPTNQLTTNNGNIAFSVAANGTGSFSYQWLFNGVVIPADSIITTTVAGNGNNGYSGDGGAATSASFGTPTGVTVDSAGNLYIANNNRIRKVGTNGIITTVAGDGYIYNGAGRYTGDGGAATNASFNHPTGITVDSAGNLYIADQNNQRIRKVGTNGIITTVAGNGNNGYSGESLVATNVSLNYPAGVTVDSAGNLYIADQYNYRIRKVQTNGYISTVVGNGLFGYSGDGGVPTSARLYNPTGVAVDSTGNLLIADSGNQRIRKVVANFSLISTVAGDGFINNGAGRYTGDGGAATNASLNYPTGVTVDSAGNLYIADQNNQRIRKVGTNGIITTMAGNGTNSYSGDGLVSTNSSLNYPTGVTVDSAGNLYIADQNNYRIRKVGLGGTLFLVLNPVVTNNIGNYQVVITDINSGNSITSSVATLNLAYPPSISQPPQNQSVVLGSNAVFLVSSAGTSPQFLQWFMSATTQSNATAVPVVTSSFVLGANMTSGGAGYLTIPAVQFIGGSGSGASGYAVVSNRMVSAITVTNTGSGYTTPPTIQIAAPTAISLTGQTNTSLTLVSVTNGNAANYFVVVTNNWGSVTSSFASLIIVPVGYNQISRPVLNNGKMSLSFVGLQGTNYALDRSFSLSPANWIPQATNPADANGNMIFTNAPDPTTNNFWRIRSVP